MIIPVRFAYLAVFVGVLGHSSAEFFAVLSGVSGPEVSAWRYVIGGFGLFVMAILISGPASLIAPLRSHSTPLIWYSLVGVTGAYLAFHWALDFASVIQVATLVTTIPIFIGLANLIINKLPLTAPKILTGLCAITGLVLLITDGAIETLKGDSESLFGIFLGITCAACVAYYAVKVKPIIAEHGALPVTAVSMIIGAIGLWICVGAVWSIWVNPLDLFDRPMVAWASLLTLGFWNTTITQVLWIGGLAAAADMTRAGYIFFLKPVIAACLAMLILNESLSVLQAFAIVVVTGSVLFELFWQNISEWSTKGSN